MLQIQWVRFGDRKAAKYLLAVNLGSRSGKCCVLVCDKVPSVEVKLLRESWPTLGRLSLGEVLIWLKKYCPNSYRLAYRELPENKLTVIQQY